MPKAKQSLTDKLHQQIVSTIRSGAYPHVSALAWGVAPKQLVDWVQRGKRAGAREPYRAFAGEVFIAQAQSRAKAEMELFQKDPKHWLQHGPGRDKPHSPGWGSPGRAGDLTAARQTELPLQQTQVVALFTWLRDELSAFPEARVHLSAKLAERTMRLGDSSHSIFDVIAL